MLTRRATLLMAGAAGVLAMFPALPAAARTHADILAEFAGTAAIEDGGVTITAPEIAENGMAVPVAVAAPGATEIILVNTRNPSPAVFRARFHEAAGSAMLATRIRLGETQDIIAYARFPDGRVGKAQVEVKVTIGGCGG